MELVVKKQTVLYVLLIFPILKINYLLHFPLFTLIYQLILLFDLVYCVILYLKRKQTPAEFVVLFLLLEIWLYIQTYIKQGDIPEVMRVARSVICIAMIFDLFSNNIKSLMKCLYYYFFVFAVINLLLMILFPNGIYSVYSIFVSAFISLTMTTIYNNYYYIVNAIVGVMNVITSAMIGGIGNSIAAESKKKNYNDFTVFNFIYMWISSWATVTLFCLYQNFMVLWVGEKLTLPLLAPVLFSIYFYALKMCDIRTTYTSAAGLWWENRSRAICETIANIVLNYLLVRIWGVYGIVLATIIPLILINFGFGAQVLFKHYFTDEKISKYFIDNLGYAVVTIISVIVTFKVTTFIGEYTVANLFIRGIVCCILPNILLWFAYFRTLKFKMAKEWVLTKIKRRH